MIDNHNYKIIIFFYKKEKYFLIIYLLINYTKNIKLY